MSYPGCVPYVPVYVIGIYAHKYTINKKHMFNKGTVAPRTKLDWAESGMVGQALVILRFTDDKKIF